MKTETIWPATIKGMPTTIPKIAPPKTPTKNPPDFHPTIRPIRARMPTIIHPNPLVCPVRNGEDLTIS
jgi:hypothetical protein